MIQGGGIAAVAITFAQYTLRLAGVAGSEPDGRWPSGDPGAARRRQRPRREARQPAAERPRRAEDRRRWRCSFSGGLWLAPLARGPGGVRPTPRGRRRRSGLRRRARADPLLLRRLAERQHASPRRSARRDDAAAGALIGRDRDRRHRVSCRSTSSTSRPSAATASRRRRRPAADAVAAPLRARRRPAGSRPRSRSRRSGSSTCRCSRPTRISYAMAQDGVFFPALSRLHPRFATPHRAILLQAVWVDRPRADRNLRRPGRLGRLRGLDLLRPDRRGASSSCAAASRPATRGPGPSARPAYPVLPILFVAASAFVVVGADPDQPACGPRSESRCMAAGVPVYCASPAAARRATASP